MAPDQRSVVPTIPGVSWWTAVLIAGTATAVGYGIDAGQKELTHVFAGFYVVGCLLAVLSVRRSGIFTAVIQPPLMLFCTVPAAYWMFRADKLSTPKDVLINCGYPLVERFPLMLGTAVAVLIIGLARWYFGTSASAPHDAEAGESAPAQPSPPGLLTALATKLSTWLGAGSRSQTQPATDATPERPRRPRRSSTTPRSTTERRSTTARTSAPRTPNPGTRTPRPSQRRSRGAAAEGYGGAGYSDYGSRDSYGPANGTPRQRPRPTTQADTDRGYYPPRERQREPQSRLSPLNPSDRPTTRNNRPDSYDRYGPRPDSPGSDGTQGSWQRSAPQRSGAASSGGPSSYDRYRSDPPHERSGDERRVEQRSHTHRRRPVRSRDSDD